MNGFGPCLKWSRDEMSGFFSSLSELFAPNKISFSKQGKGKGMGELSFFDLSTQFPTLLETTWNHTQIKVKFFFNFF